MAYIGNKPVSATFAVDTFSGNGSTDTFTLRYAPASKSSILVFVNNVRQNTSSYSLSNTNITLSPAPASGTNNIEVVFLGIGSTPYVVGVNSVGESELKDGSVNGGKLQSSIIRANNIVNGTIDNSKLVDANITGAKLVANTITTRELADNAVLQNNITNGAVTETKLSTTGVAAGTYGNTTNIPVITVTAQGRVTNVSNLAFSTVPAANSINQTQIVPNIPLIFSNIFVTNTATLGRVVEEANIVAQGVGTTTTITPNDPGVIYFTGNSSDNTTINFTGLTSMNVGNVLNYTVILTNQSGSAKYVSTIQIDGQTQGSSNTFWLGGRPTFGLANTEIYTFNIIKMSATPTYNVFAQVSNFRF